MKRSRSELVHSVVGSYLKKRQFTENEMFKKNELKLQQSAQEMATRGLIINESCVKNVVNFSSISADASQVEQQFIKLKSFVSEATEPFKTELTYILYPMFVHMYLELIQNSQKNHAQKFHQRHSALFTSQPNYAEMINLLKKINNNNDLSQFPMAKAFRENKYIIELSRDTHLYLLMYLKNADSLLLLQIFNLRIEVKEPTTVNLHLYEEKERAANVQMNPNIPKLAETKSPAMKSLLQAIKKVRDGPPPFPSVCLYTIMNAGKGVSCTNLNQDITLLAAGYEDSSIHLWNLTPSERPANVAVSTLQLGCDDVEKESEENTGISRDEDILRGHYGSVHSMCFTPDSSLMLSCSEDTTVRAWDMNSYSNVAIYRGHNYPIWDIDYSSIGVYFATASHDRTAKLWSLDRTYPIRYFAGHSMDVDCVQFHPNCNYVATGSSDRTVRLWSVQDGKMVRMFQGHRGTVFTLAFSPNGQYLASAGEDRRIKVWDLGAGALFKELRGHIDTVYSLCFNKDSSILVSGGLESSIRVWDIRKGVTYGSAIDGHTSPELIGSCVAKSTNVLSVKYSAKNLLVAVGMQPTK